MAAVPPLQGADLGRHVVIRGVLEAGVESSRSLQVEEDSICSPVAGKVVDWTMGMLPGLTIPGAYPAWRHWVPMRC